MFPCRCCVGVCTAEKSRRANRVVPRDVSDDLPVGERRSRELCAVGDEVPKIIEREDCCRYPRGDGCQKAETAVLTAATLPAVPMAVALGQNLSY